MSQQELKDCISAGDRHWKVVFWVSLVLSAVLVVISFFIPPHGVIDGSVLGAVGELFAFPTLYAVYGIIQSGKGVTFRKGDMEIKTRSEEGDG